MTEILKYMEKHKLIITKNNFDMIRNGMLYKFPDVEKLVRTNRKSVKVQFVLPEDYLPIVELSKKREIAIELRKAVKEIEVDPIGGTNKSSISSTIRIERPKKSIQVVKKEGCKAIEMVSVEAEKKYTSKEEEINNLVESMHNDKEELNVIILPDKKNKKDNEAVDFPKLIRDEEGKVRMICEGARKEEFEAVFKDDPIIEIPVVTKVEKKERMMKIC
jgi:hypothetical protein